MTEPDDRRARILESCWAAALLVWRIAAVPFALLYRDWVAILALYWMFSIFGQRTKSWPWVTLGTMLLLAGLYLRGQFPHTLDLLGIRL